MPDDLSGFHRRVLLNEDQAKARDEILAAREPGGRHLLRGPAGTGKTVLVADVVRDLVRGKANVAVTAPTHQAVAVLRNKLAAAGLGDVTCRTIHSLLGLRPKMRGEVQTFVRDKSAKPVEATDVVVDECFVGSTLVDTPCGPRRIDALAPGDTIQNAIGVDRVVAVKRKEAVRATQIECGGKTITSSECHRFFTRRGIVRAAQLRPGDELVSLSEAVRLLRSGVQSEGMDGAVLQRALLSALVQQAPGLSSENEHPRAQDRVGSRTQTLPRIRDAGSGGSDRADPQAEPSSALGCSREDIGIPASEWTQAADQGRQWHGCDEAATRHADRAGSGLGDGAHHPDRDAPARIPDALQDRLGVVRKDVSDRGGRLLARSAGKADAGCEEGRISAFARVDRVEVLEPGDPRLDRERDAAGKLYLYDIEAERHSSFAVEEVLVHNCSMLGAEMMMHIRRHLSMAYVLLCGDPAQLPPINEDESESFSTKSCSVLDRVVRQAEGNPIIKVATAIRKSQGGAPDWSWCRPNHDGNAGVFVPRAGDDWIKKAFCSEAFDADPDSFRYLAWTNSRVERINRRVRAWRYGENIPTPFMPGERAMFRAPVLRGDSILFNTNEEAEVLAIEPDRFIHQVPACGQHTGWTATVPSWRITMPLAEGLTTEVHMPSDNDAYQRVCAQIADEAVGHNKRWDHLQEFKTSMAILQPIYALTVHSSQGSTFARVFVDLPSIRARFASHVLEAQQLLYVAATRPTTALMLMGI